MQIIKNLLTAFTGPSQPEGTLHWFYRILSIIIAVVCWSYVYLFVCAYIKCQYLPHNWKDWIVSFNVVIIAILFTAVAVRGRVPSALAKYLLSDNDKKQEKL